MSLETRIRSGLKAAAANESAGKPTDIEEVKAAAAKRVRRDRSFRFATTGIALLTVVLVVANLVAINQEETVPVAPVLAEGETLLATDPVIVQGAPAPEPLFDTGSLGVEQPLTPLSEIRRIEAAVALHLQMASDPELLRITSVGTTTGGNDIVILHLYENSPIDGRRLQTRCVIPSGGCAGEFVDDPAIDPTELLQPDPRDGPTHVVGGPGQLTWDVPLNAAVVVLTVNGDPVWQRPIAGVVVFDTVLVDGDRFEGESLDETGNPLTSFALTARDE